MTAGHSKNIWDVATKMRQLPNLRCGRGSRVRQYIRSPNCVSLVLEAPKHELLLEAKTYARCDISATGPAKSFFRVGLCGLALLRRVADMRPCWFALLLISAPTACPSLHGETEQSANWQIGHDYWSSKDGAPGDIQALAQTNDGFLWLGSPSGLFRFDGTHFERFKPPFGDRLLSTNVMCLLAPSSGGLWIGYTFGGFSFLYNGRLMNYPLEVPVRYFARSQSGIVWAATSKGLWKFEGSNWQPVGADWNAPTGTVLQVAFDAEGTLWALTGFDFGPMDLIYLKARSRQFRTAAKSLFVHGFTLNADGEVVTEPKTSFTSLPAHTDVIPSVWPVLRKDSHQIVDRNNGIWVAPKSPAVVTRISSRDRFDDALTNTSTAHSETWNFSPFPLAKLIDREGNVWFGEIKGLHRFWYSPFHKLDLPKTAAENVSFALAPDDHGAIWMSVGGWYTPSALLHTSRERESAGRQAIQAEIDAPFAHRAPDGTFWFIGHDCLLHLVNGKFVRVPLPPAVATQAPYLQAITEDQRGGMWVSFLRYGLYRLANGAWTPYGGQAELPKTEVLAAFTDSVGRVWLGYIKNRLAVMDGDSVRLFDTGEGLRLGNITAIYGRGPRVWIGGEFGLAVFDSGRLQNVEAVDDEWLRGISGIVETKDGDLWLNGLSGIFHISKAEISEFSRNPSYRLKGEHFGRRDGLPGVPTQLHPLPTAIEGTDGRLWFGLQNGVVWLDPATYAQHRVAPPTITIESISADGTGHAPAPALSFPARTASVQISYAAVSLSDPEAIRFRYQLQEADTAWQETNTPNPAVYRNLAPGSYHFTVAASDTDGVWSHNAAGLVFTILPTWYQTNLFRGTGAAVLLLMVWGLHRFRLRQLAREFNLRLEDRVVERTSIIETIPAFVWTASPDGQLTYVNERLFSYIGVPREAVCGQGWVDYVHPDDRPEAINRWMRSVATGSPMENQYRLRRADGAYRWFHVPCQLCHPADGRPPSWYGLLIDIEDRRNIEEALGRTQSKLSRATQVATVGEIAASIAHEINQPLGAIVANGDACLRWLSADSASIGKAREAAERIVRDGMEAAEVIRRIRSLFKGGVLNKTALDLNDIIGEVVRLLGNEIVRKSISLEMELGAGLPRVVGDRVQLQQLTHNLIANAIEAMDSVTDRRKTLFVGSSRSGESILVEIRDAGIGIKEPDRIFDAFFTTKKTGLGMGLAICRSIIEAHQGKLWVSSTADTGSTFYFSVPSESTVQ
jgi:PAS domain S-box-containing protein